jgi:hypothetical protein
LVDELDRTSGEAVLMKLEEYLSKSGPPADKQKLKSTKGPWIKAFQQKVPDDKSKQQVSANWGEAVDLVKDADDPAWNSVISYTRNSNDAAWTPVFTSALDGRKSIAARAAVLGTALTGRSTSAASAAAASDADLEATGRSRTVGLFARAAGAAASAVKAVAMSKTVRAAAGAVVSGVGTSITAAATGVATGVGTLFSSSSRAARDYSDSEEAADVEQEDKDTAVLDEKSAVDRIDEPPATAPDISVSLVLRASAVCSRAQSRAFLSALCMPAAAPRVEPVALESAADKRSTTSLILSLLLARTA